jgi:hypothetical protein
MFLPASWRWDVASIGVDRLGALLEQQDALIEQ